MKNKKDEDLEESSSMKSYIASTNDSTGEDDLSENEFDRGDVLTQKTPEEESEEEETSVNKQSNKSRTKKLSIENNKNHLNKNRSNSVKSIFNIEDLTVDDEIYTLQCPDNFKKQDLCNKILDFSEFKTTFTSNNELYHMKLLNSDKEFITLAIPDNETSSSLLMLPLEGHIVIHKDVNTPACEPMDEDFKKCSVAFPNDIKVRHPLLGVDWKEHIDLANAVFKKKWKKAKRERKRNSDQMETKKIKVEKDELEIVSLKKKKKKKTA